MVNSLQLRRFKAYVPFMGVIIMFYNGNIAVFNVLSVF